MPGGKIALFNHNMTDLVKDLNKDAFTEAFNNEAKVKPIQRDQVFDSQKSEIRVGPDNLKFDFDMQDPIFELCQINKNCLKRQGKKIKDAQIAAKMCYACRKPLPSDLKKVGQCEFCANFGHSDCVNTKMYPFPQTDELVKGEQESGQICLVCETKLHLNTVTCDILNELLRCDKRLEQRLNRMDEIQRDVKMAKKRTDEDRMTRDQQLAENKDRVESLQFKIDQQKTNLSKREEETVQINKRICQRREEKATADERIEKLYRETEQV